MQWQTRVLAGSPASVPGRYELRDLLARADRGVRQGALNVTVPPGCVGEVDVPGNASELVVSESGVVVWRHGAAAGTAEGVTAVAALADGVRLSTVSGLYVVAAE